MNNTRDVIVSVIVPAYNCGDSLHKCIKSLISQDFNDLEIIIVDDGSDEYTRKICDDYAKKIDYIYVLHKHNEGPSLARLSGLKIAKGKYISFVDSDDYVEKFFIKDLVNALEYNDADIAQSGCFYDFADNKEKNSFLRYSFLLIKGKRECSEFFASQKYCTNYLCNKIYKKSLFNNLIFPNIYRSEDRCILTQLYGKSNRIINIDSIGYHYVQHAKSLSHGGLGDNEYDIFKASDFIENYYMTYYPNLCSYNHSFHCSQAIQLLYNCTNDKQISFLRKQVNKYRLTDMKFVSKGQKYLILSYKIMPSLSKWIYKKRTN